MVGVDLGRRILTTNDEARFPLLAQDILTRGDWLFPVLNGTVYHNKPILLAWLITLVSWPVGYVTQFTAVIPSAAAAFATALLIFGLGREMFGAEAGKYAALIAVTTQGAFMHGRIPMPDMLMTAVHDRELSDALADGARRAARLDRLLPVRRPRVLGQGSGGFLPLIIAAAWAVFGRSAASWRALKLPLGVPLLVAIVAPWPIFRLFRHAEGLRQAVVHNQILWYLPQDLRAGMVAEPIQNAFGILFPWVFLLPIVLVEAVRLLRRRGPERDALLLLIVASVTMFVVIAASQQQRFRYYLPLVPPVSLLIGWWADSVLSRRLALRVPWRVCAAVGALLAAAGVAGAFSRRNALNEVAMVWPALRRPGDRARGDDRGGRRSAELERARPTPAARVRGRLGRLRRARRRQLPLGARAPERGVRLRGPAQADGAAPARVAGGRDPGAGRHAASRSICAGRSCRPAPRAISARSCGGDAPAVAIVTDRALTSPEDSDGFTVLLRDRLALPADHGRRVSQHPTNSSLATEGVTP